MKKINILRSFVVTLLAAAIPGTASAASLLEVYQQALQSDPRIHEAEARRLASLEASPQARSFLLPQVSFDARYDETDTDGTVIPQDAGGVPQPPVPANTEVETTAWGFSVRQTIFRWDQIVGLRQAEKTVARAEADYEAAQQDLIVRVVLRYCDVLGAEDRLTAIHANRNAIARQLEQAQQRFEVGLIAITDVQESQARYDQAVADEIRAKQQLATAREFLREITGVYVSELSAPSEDLPMNSPDPENQVAWVDLALDQNLALVSSRIDEQLARDEISFRRTGHYPTLDLVASTGDTETTFNRTVGGVPIPEQDSDDSRDRIGLEFTIPLFSGGGTSSRVREAVYLHRASRENLQRVTRETERQARDAYLSVLSDISRVQALQQAVQSSQTALEATQAGFDVGTRTIVDVLNFQFSLYESITNYQQSRYDYILNYMRLKQAAGTLEVQDLERLEAFMIERKTPEQQFEEEEAAAAGGTP